MCILFVMISILCRQFIKFSELTMLQHDNPPVIDFSFPQEPAIITPDSWSVGLMPLQRIAKSSILKDNGKTSSASLQKPKLVSMRTKKATNTVNAVTSSSSKEKLEVKSEAANATDNKENVQVSSSITPKPPEVKKSKQPGKKIEQKKNTSTTLTQSALNRANIDATYPEKTQTNSQKTLNMFSVNSKSVYTFDHSGNAFEVKNMNCEKIKQTKYVC